MAKIIVSGNGGFIGSHLADYLLEQGHEVVGIDNFVTGDKQNVHPKVRQYEVSITSRNKLKTIFEKERPDWVFHEAANARTLVSVDDPFFNNDVNITGTLNMLVAARDVKVKRFVFASSCILNAPNTPYYVSKLAGEEYVRIFQPLYGLSTISLRYSNVYGSIRQSEKGAAINAIASLRKTKRETGRVWITGDGTQTRDWSHVADIARANLLAAQSTATGWYDICTGVAHSMNEVAAYFKCPIDYIADRPGDVKHLSASQNPEAAYTDFGYRYQIPFNQASMEVYL